MPTTTTAPDRRALTRIGMALAMIDMADTYLRLGALDPREYPLATDNARSALVSARYHLDRIGEAPDDIPDGIAQAAPGPEEEQPEETELEEERRLEEQHAAEEAEEPWDDTEPTPPAPAPAPVAPTLPDSAASRLFARLIKTPTPPFRARIRQAEGRRKTWARHVRQLFRDLDLCGISVTAPSYSQAQAIEVSLPAAAEHDLDGMHDFSECAHCQQHTAAARAAERIILGAFPDLDNRSDSQSDHFDYCLSVH